MKAPGTILNIALLLLFGLGVLGSVPVGAVGPRRSAVPAASSPPASPSLGNIAAIAAGGDHTCAVTTDGGVKCWGRNEDGQLGDSTTTDRSTPVDVVGLTSGVTAIAAGWHHTCALTAGDRVKCWGHNRYGQLGDGTLIDRTAPVDVVGLKSGVTAITAGGWGTCALTMAGGVKCWGYNHYGQLGDGSRTDRSTPVDVVGLTSGAAVCEAGWGHTCSLTMAGGVKCWGYGYFGRLGDGSWEHRSTPVDVVGLTNHAAAIAVGWYHVCVLTRSGSVKCWGENYWGALGDGTGIWWRTKPSDAVGLARGVTAIAAGWGHTCALTVDGGVKCWGYNKYGQLGDGTTTRRKSPVDVVG